MLPFCFSETSHAIILDRKARALRKELQRDDLRSVLDIGISKNVYFKHSFLRPLQMLFKSPIVFLFALFIAVIYGYVYLLFTTISIVFVGQYGWAEDLTGLAYLGLGIGFLLGLVICGKLSDQIIIKKTKANGGVYEPEFRLPLMMGLTVCIPISLFMYGWMTDKHVHWIGPIISLVPFGVGMLSTFLSSQTYMIDAFPNYAASSIAALTIIRSLFGAFLPMAGLSLYNALGLGWGNSLLGFVATAMIPIPFIFYKYGKYLRVNYPLQL